MRKSFTALLSALLLFMFAGLTSCQKTQPAPKVTDMEIEVDFYPLYDPDGENKLGTFRFDPQTPWVQFAATPYPGWRLEVSSYRLYYDNGTAGKRFRPREAGDDYFGTRVFFAKEQGGAYTLIYSTENTSPWGEATVRDMGFYLVEFYTVDNPDYWINCKATIAIEVTEPVAD